MVTIILFVVTVNLMFYNVYTCDDSSTNEIRLEMFSGNKIFKVFLDKPLNIIIQRCDQCHNARIESCWSHDSLYIMNVTPYGNDFILEIPKAAADMNGTWACYILINNYYKSGYYFLNFTILVKDPNDIQPHQQIIVNHLILPMVRDKYNYAIYRAEYYYMQDDTIDVYCISKKDTCSVQMTYGGARSELTYGDRFKHFQISSQLGSLVRDIECICSCTSSYITTKVVIRFVLSTSEDINLSINGNRLQTFFTSGVLNHTYGYFANENLLEVICKTNNGKFISVPGGPRNLNLILKDIDPRIQQFDITIFENNGGQIIITIRFARIQLNELNHMIMVNHLILPIRQHIDGRNTAEYYHAEVNTVTVSCISLKDKCSGHIKDGYSGIETYQVDLPRSYYILWCTCNSNSTTPVELHFYNQPDRDIDLSIDGKRLAVSTQLGYAYYNYGYDFDDRNLDIKCGAYNQKYISSYFWFSELKATYEKYYLEKTIDPYSTPIFAITINSQDSLPKYLRIEIHFTRLPQHAPVSPTTVVLSTTTVTDRTTPTTKMFIGDTTDTVRTTPTTKMYTEDTTVTPLTTNPSTIVQSSVTNDTEYSINQEIFIAVGIVMMICLIGVITYSYKIIQRNRFTRRGLGDNYNNLQNDAATAIPVYPPQWESDQSAPIVNQTNDVYETDDDIYENTAIKRQIPENIYINSIQNDRNIEAGGPSELTYADIDHSKKFYANQGKTNRTPGYTLNQHREPYAQIEVGHSIQAARTMNEANYVNSDNYDYVEPTYSEVVR